MIRRRSLIFVLCSGLALCAPVFATTVTQTLQTFYPPPEGNYNNLTDNEFFNLATPGTACASNGQNVYLTNNNGFLWVCDGSTTAGAWQYRLTKQDLWLGNGVYMYPQTSTQNVGIGTSTAPIATLDVGNINTAGFMHLSGVLGQPYTTQGAYVNWNDATGGTGESDFVSNQGGGSGGFQFFNLPTPGAPPAAALVNVSGTGNVTIGTGTTNVQTVNGSVTETGQGAFHADVVVNGRIRTGDGSSNGGVWFNSSSFVGQAGSGAGIGFWTRGNTINGAWGLLVANGGNVGIGVNDTNPGALLELEGTSSSAVSNLSGMTLVPIRVCRPGRVNCGVVAMAQSGDNNYYAAAAL